LTVILSILLGGQTDLNSAAGTPPWEDKVDAQVLTSSQNGETEFLVVLAEQADLGAAENLGSKLEKGTYVFETLSNLAARTQKPILDSLDSLGVDYKPFWVVNMIWARGDFEVIQQIAQRADVASIQANPTVQFSPPEDRIPSQPQEVNGIEWNISKINAPMVWDLGYTGEGIVIGGQDTGYDWDHPALINQYRGWDGANADHNYNWHDAIHEDLNNNLSNPCGFNSTIPCDDHNHGTHTMGTMVGDDGGSYQIGVAPGAKWIGCRNMEEGVGSPATYTECYQWFIAPTKVDGSEADPAKAPHVINNSWSCTYGEECTSPGILLSVVQSVRAAGIVTVHSAGNAGSGCGTVNLPAAIYDESFSVGATNNSDVIASFSSRGPVTVDGSNRLKPDISAPGVNIISSKPGGSYGGLSGTSMAAPHVAGLVALLLSADPDLIGQVNEIETIINESAVPLYPTILELCGGDTTSSYPNHTYGYGRIDAWAAIQSVLEILFFPIIHK